MAVCKWLSICCALFSRPAEAWRRLRSCSLLVLQFIGTFFRFAALLLTGILLNTRCGSAADSPANAVPQAMVILKGNCFGCHNVEKKKGGLLLTSRSDVLKGSKNGPVLIPGKADQSKILKVLASDSDPHMPPKKQLSDKQIATLQTWIENGADWDEKALASFGTETPLDKLGPLPQSYGPVLALALSPDGKRLAVARGGEIALYDTANTNRASIAQLREHRDAVQSVAWNSAENLLASGSYREVAIWNTESWKLEQRLTNELTGRITSLAFSPDGASLFGADAMVTKSGVVRVWQTKDWKLKSSWEAHRDAIMSLDVSHDGKLLATASTDKQVKIWSLSSLSNQVEVAKFEGHMGHVLGAGFSPDDSMLATVGADKVLNLWDTKTKEQKITLPKHPAPLTAVAWAANGKSLVSACEDGAVRVYTDFKAHSGKEQSEGAQMRALPATDDLLYSVAISSDGKTIYAGTHDGAVYVWNSDGKLKWKLPPQTPRFATLEAAE